MIFNNRGGKTIKLSNLRTWTRRYAIDSEGEQISLDSRNINLVYRYTQKHDE